MDIAILGAGGHARSVYDCLALSSDGPLEIQFFDDRYPALSSLEDQPVVGVLNAALRPGAPKNVFVAIGDNALRFRLSRQLQALNRSFLTIHHPNSIISPRAFISAGVVTIAGSVINSGARLGEGAIVNTLSSVGHDCIMHPFAHLASGVNLGGGAIIGFAAFLGLGVKVAPGVTIGEWAVVGAGSVVLGDLPPRMFSYGVPARVIRDLTEDELPSSEASK